MQRFGVICGVAIVAGVVALAPAVGAQPRGSTARPWMNTSLSAQQRAKMLRAQMTLAEKIDLMTSNPEANAPYAYYNAPIPRLGIPALKMADAGGGVAPRGWSLPGTGGAATAMPSEMALGATWSTAQAQQMADVIGAEVRETGQNVLLGPDTDIAREPWFGRISESEGEEPVLNGTLNAAYVKAVQAHHVIATMKHFTGYNQETNRNVGQNSVIDERALHEVYALAFETVIREANLGAVMCSYNKINGTYSCQNANTLRTLLKGQLKFTGFVLTDFGALHATLQGLQGGTDMETGTATFYDGALLAAAQSGQASIAQIDEAVLRILTTEFRLGLFDTDYTPTSIPVDAHNQVAREVEDHAITLLKNDGDVLPLTGDDAKSIALIGADANIIAAESGSAWVDPTTTTSTLQGLEARAGAGAVTWTPGNDPVNAASMIETADQTTVPSSVLTPASGSGTGLTTSYWDTPNFAGNPAVTRTERQVSYDFGFPTNFPGWLGAGTQVPPPPSNFFLEQQSVTYDGYLSAPATGRYTLSLTGWGDATMSLDGTTVIDMTGKAGRRVVTATLNLTAGTRYKLHIAYRATHPISPLHPGALVLQWKAPANAVVPSVAAAVAAAKAAKVAVVYVRDFESEEPDRVALKLPQNAEQLIRAVAAANPHTVVVLATGGPVTMPWLSSVKGVVQTYFGGQAQGAALADVLFGDVDPSGHLTVTYPARQSDVPVANPWDGTHSLTVNYSEGIDVGYKAYQTAGITPLFPFGYGLSYTSFKFDAANALATVQPDGSILVRFRISNTGARAGTQTAQVYLGLPARTGEPPKRLAAFKTVTLNAGQTKTVQVRLRPNAPTHPLSYWDTTRHAWVTAPGSYRVYVGDSSADTPLQTSVHL